MVVMEEGLGVGKAPLGEAGASKTAAEQASVFLVARTRGKSDTRNVRGGIKLVV